MSYPDYEKDFSNFVSKKQQEGVRPWKYLMASWAQTEYEEKTSVKTVTLILLSQCILEDGFAF